MGLDIGETQGRRWRLFSLRDWASWALVGVALLWLSVVYVLPVDHYVRKAKVARDNADLAKRVAVETYSPDERSMLVVGEEGDTVLADRGTRRPLAFIGKGISAATFSPDSQLLATGTWDGKLRLWATAEGRLRAAADSLHTTVLKLTFSPDGRILASGAADGRVTLWNSPTLTRVAELFGATAPVVGLSFSPTGRELSVSDRTSQVRVWDVATGRLLDRER